MMGKQSDGQGRLFYSFNLDEHVPADHLLRGIDRFLDLGDLRRHLADFYSHTGRPSIDPELMIRMLLVGYCFGIRSERRLCEEVHLNLAYRWFCRLSLEHPVPDHSTFSKNRHGRFRDSDAFRALFESVVSRCIAEGLVGSEGFAIDASVVRADANKARRVGTDEPIDWHDKSLNTRAVREYLDALDAENPATKRSALSLTDPAARFTAARIGAAFFAYSTNYLIDVKAGVIVDVEATGANRTEEVEVTKAMLDRVEARHEIKPKQLIGDTSYGSGPFLHWLVEDRQIEPMIPVWDKSDRQDGILPQSAFTYDESEDRYVCPKGKPMQSTGRRTCDDTLLYRAKVAECRICELRLKCCPRAEFRTIKRSIYERSREVARRLANTDDYRRARKNRKKVEMLFAHLKRILKLDRLRLRGPSGARDEFLLAATAQNLRRMAKRWQNSEMILAT